MSTALAAEQDRQRLTTAVMQTLQHELKSPLSIICGYTELLLADRDASFSATQAGDLALILQNGRHLERLLTSMMDLAQVLAGTLPLVRQDVALAPLLRRLQSATEP